MPNLLLFQCDATRYALTAESVETIVWRPALSGLDGMPAWFAGLLNLHGQPVPVMDLARFMGHAPPPVAATQQLIIVRQAERLAALIVDQVDDLKALADDALRVSTPAEMPKSPQSGVIRGEITDGDALVMWLDTDSLIAAIPEHPDGLAAQASPSPLLTEQSDGPMTQLLDERRHRLAERQAAHAGEEDRHPFAIITTGDRRYAIELDRVIEFGGLRHVTAIPQSPASVLGCMNLRGEFIAVIDLNRLIDGSESGGESQVVILSLEGDKVALRIRAVERLTEAPARGVIPLHDAVDADPMAKLLLMEEKEMTAIMDCNALLAALTDASDHPG